jgi:hypothetical protein
MREIRQSGSEGGAVMNCPYPYRYEVSLMPSGANTLANVLNWRPCAFAGMTIKVQPG